MLMMNMF